jgi:rubrerythrin
MDELSVLTQAMKLEMDGKAFYLMAAGISDDPETTAMFRTLAEDEEHHYNYIERQYNQRKDGKDWLPIPELEKVEAVDAKEPIFPAGKQVPKILPDKPTLEDALLFGLDAEVKSYELYTQSVKQTKNPNAREMFEKLAAAERGHFDTLMMRYESYFDYPR